MRNYRKLSDNERAAVPVGWMFVLLAVSCAGLGENALHDFLLGLGLITLVLGGPLLLRLSWCAYWEERS